MSPTKGLGAVYARIFFVEASYWVISIGMVFLNEDVLTESVLTENLTVFITLYQILFSLSILLTLSYVTKHYLEPTPNLHRPVTKIGTTANDEDSLIDDESDDENVLFVASSERVTSIDGHQNHSAMEASKTTGDLLLSDKHARKSESSDSNNQDSLKHLFTVNIPCRLNLSTCKLVIPLSILYLGMLLLNNFCLKNVGVAFYFVSRSLTTVFNVIFTHFLINESVSRGALICCGFIVLGFILGIDQENVIGSLSVMGVLFGVASSLFTSLFSIYTKKTLAKLDKNIWILVLYNNLNSIVLCSPLLLIHGDIQALLSEKALDLSFWLLLSISGVMAFFISIVTNASIKYTSPLTHNISGTAKACLQTVIAVIYHKDHKSHLWWTSNITILVASAAYSRIKQLEMERKTASESIGQRSNQEKPSNASTEDATNKDDLGVSIR